MSKNGKSNDLEKLDQRLSEASHPSDHSNFQQNNEKNEKASALSLAFRVGVELVSAVAVGTGLGWALDYWLETRPWLMILFIIIGVIAGILNVYRVARGFNYSGGYRMDNSAVGIKGSSKKNMESKDIV